MGNSHLVGTGNGNSANGSSVVVDLVRATRVLVLALPVVNLPDQDEQHIQRLAGYLLAEAKRPRPDAQRIQLLGSLLRSQLLTGPASATLGAVLADSYDEALNGGGNRPGAGQTATAAYPSSARVRRIATGRVNPGSSRVAR